MAQKRAGRGRPRKSPRAATGFPATRRRKASVKSASPAASLTTTTTGPTGPTSSNEPTSAFEALCQVTSAEYERLSNHNTTNCDNRSDSSSKSTEENRQVLTTPSDVQLPAWYGAHIAPSKPYKNELILPPKKKKYLHYLAEADDDNQIINNPFPHPQPSRRAAPQESQPVTCPVPPPGPAPSPGPAPTMYFGILSPGEMNVPPDGLAPLKFNPTPVAPPVAKCQDTKTFSDVLDEHISRLIIQNDVIVSKQPGVVMSKRGRSRETAAGSDGGACGGEASSSSTTSRTSGTHSESMVKTLLSSKITRKTMLKENSVGRQQVRPCGSAFSYLNPEKSAIKDLLIKTYEEKGVSGSALSGGQTSLSTTTPEPVQDSPDYTASQQRQQQQQFKTPSATPPVRTGLPLVGSIVYRVSSDQRSGALVVPDLRDSGAAAGWTVSPGHEWVFIDERGRRRVRPEVTVYPETACYQTAGSVAASPGGRSLRSPSADSMHSSESSPSSVSFTESRHRVQSNGTFQQHRSRGQQEPQESKMPPPSVASVVRTAGTFHPGSQLSDARLYIQESNSEAAPEFHEKTLNALRGHLTGRRPADESVSPKSDEGSVTQTPAQERSSIPHKKRKTFHIAEEPVAAAPTTVALQPLALEPISPAVPLDELRFRRQTVIQEPAGFSGYATYVNENHASHLGFYTDLSRQYSTNVAFAQTLLQQGHYYPSFRYSCVTTNSIRGGRPIHVQNGESVSMYANWSALPSAVNPTIRVDSSIYGKKKTDGSYFSVASKRSVNVCATSVETYTRKRQLILSGINSFLPSEAAKLVQPDTRSAVTVPHDDAHGQATSSDRFFAPRDMRAPAGRAMESIKVEDVSEDDGEEADEEEGACSDCGRRFPKPKMRNSKNSDQKFTCAHCLMSGRSRAGTFPKQARPVPQSRRNSEALSKRDSNSAVDQQQQQQQSSHIEKPLMAQLKQKIIGHQHSGPSTASINSRPDSVVRRSPAVKTELDEASVSGVDHDVMDLSVKKAAAVPEIPDWRTMEGASNRFPCRHCPKVFNKEGQLYLHSRVHEMETTGKAERKASKARTERSSSPGSVSATNENPRPFFCAECNVGFRIHGHLQKHLRSKGHITQLECLNRLPCGFYAELERQNLIAKLHTLIDTADCAKAFSCLTQLAKTVIVGVTAAEEQQSPPPT